MFKNELNKVQPRYKWEGEGEKKKERIRDDENWEGIRWKEWGERRKKR